MLAALPVIVGVFKLPCTSEPAMVNVSRSATDSFSKKKLKTSLRGGDQSMGPSTSNHFVLMIYTCDSYRTVSWATEGAPSLTLDDNGNLCLRGTQRRYQAEFLGSPV